MRRKATGINLIAGAVAALLLAFIVIGIITGPAKGAIEEGGNAFNNAAGEIGGWGCKDINDPAAKSVNFKTFMETMAQVYKDCNEDDSKCGTRSCRSMTLKIGNDGEYYEIDKAMLENKKELSAAFNNWFGANIYCNEDNADWGGYEIDASYPSSFPVKDLEGTDYYLRQIKAINSAQTDPKLKAVVVCETQMSDYQITGKFAVADGSKVTIKAKKQKDSWATGGEHVDLKVKIDGGTFVKDATPVPAPSTECDAANEKTKCAKTSWGYCDNEKCAYNYYCAKKGTDDKARCKPITLSCPMNPVDVGDINTYLTSTTASPCTAASGQLIYPCSAPNTFKTEMLSLSNLGLELKVTDTSDGTTGTAIVGAGNEEWFYKEFSQIKSTSDALFFKPLKLSVMVKEVKENPPSSGNYDVKLWQGCY